MTSGRSPSSCAATLSSGASASVRWVTDASAMSSAVTFCGMATVFHAFGTTDS
ncbi:hypothetical protein ACWV95_03980 [Streptomyces albus]